MRAEAPQGAALALKAIELDSRSLVAMPQSCTPPLHTAAAAAAIAAACRRYTPPPVPTLPQSNTKRRISPEDWQRKLREVNVRKEDMNRVVMNFLVTEVGALGASSRRQAAPIGRLLVCLRLCCGMWPRCSWVLQPSCGAPAEPTALHAVPAGRPPARPAPPGLACRATWMPRACLSARAAPPPGWTSTSSQTAWTSARRCRAGT